MQGWHRRRRCCRRTTLVLEQHGHFVLGVDSAHGVQVQRLLAAAPASAIIVGLVVLQLHLAVDAREVAIPGNIAKFEEKWVTNCSKIRLRSIFQKILHEVLCYIQKK